MGGGRPRPAPRTIDLPPADAEDRLRHLTGEGAEERPGQRAYAAAITAAFAPRAVRDTPNMVLAEAGTGIGKTWAISPPPACGPSAPGERCGFRPIPRRYNAS